jgi:hypothetical protein
LDRKAAREIKGQQAASESAAKHATAKYIKTDRKAHEVAVASHLVQLAISAALASGTTTKDAIATKQAASAVVAGEEESSAMHD